MANSRGRWVVWGLGGLAGLGLLALLTLVAIYLSASFVVNYARIPGSNPEQGELSPPAR